MQAGQSRTSDTSRINPESILDLLVLDPPSIKLFIFPFSRD